MITRGWAVDAAAGHLVAAGGWLYDDAAQTWSTLTRPKGAPPSPGVAAWAEDTLLVLGGVDWGEADAQEAKTAYSTGFWAHRPAANQ